VGLLCGREFSFPPAFIERVKTLGAKDGVTAEFVKLGGTHMDEPAKYRVIVDRISHEVEYYRGYLKHAVLQGTYVINNPFWWTADDKYFNYSVAAKLGVAIPKTVLLPQKGYPKDVDINAESLHNLEYPIDWDALLDYVGRPAILKPYSGGGWKHVYKVHTKEELWAAYAASHSAKRIFCRCTTIPRTAATSWITNIFPRRLASGWLKMRKRLIWRWATK